MLNPRKLLRTRLSARRKQYRESIENRIPKRELSLQHMQNCKLLLNRDQLLKELPHQGIVAELGVNEGEFTSRILSICRPRMLHLVDTWSSERYHDGLYQAVLEKFEPHISQHQVTLSRNLSTDAAVQFEDRYFDWVYIDTSHSYETTRDELLSYAPKVKHGGLLTGHDYSQGNWVSGIRYGVIEAVHEFCVEHDWELVFLTLDPIERQSFAIKRRTNQTAND